MKTDKPFIEVKNVSVSYHGKEALVDALLDIYGGSLTAIVGMNGAGKSTLFKVIMGFITPQSGSVRIDGVPVSEAQKKGIISYVPQSEDVDWNFPVSVWDVVMMGRYGYMGILRKPKDQDEEDVREALEKVGMLSMKERQIGELSGGQRKRVFLARALAQKAKVMLLDEPFSGIDAASEREITKLLLEQKEKGNAIVMSTHELTSLTEYCDHVALIKKTVLAYGETNKVFTPENVAKTFDGIVHRIKFNGAQ